MNNRIEKRMELKALVSRVWRALTDYREFGEWFRVKLDGPFVPGQISRQELTHQDAGVLREGQAPSRGKILCQCGGFRGHRRVPDPNHYLLLRS